MIFDVLTIFPEFFDSPLKEGILRRALAGGRIAVHVHNIRDFARDKHRTTDDRPFGGGEGMVMKPEPIAAALENARRRHGRSRVILLSPRGKTYGHATALRLREYDQLLLICGRYEGVDERISRSLVDEEISIGDYILSGGEPAAMVLIDSITRLLPGVLGCGDSAERDTFSRGLLKHPQYTRPRVFRGMEVPDVLLSGDHAAVARWRFLASVRETLKRRPELLTAVSWTAAEEKLLRESGLYGEVCRAGSGNEAG